MLADTDKSYAELRLLIADQSKRQQNLRFAPFTVFYGARCVCCILRCGCRPYGGVVKMGGLNRLRAK
jgi:hypothetical protein